MHRILGLPRSAFAGLLAITVLVGGCVAEPASEAEAGDDEADLTAQCVGDACETLGPASESSLATVGGQVFWTRRFVGESRYDLVACTPARGDCNRPRTVRTFAAEESVELAVVKDQLVLSSRAFEPEQFLVRAYRPSDGHWTNIAALSGRSPGGWMLPDGDRIMLDVGVDHGSHASGAQFYSCGLAESSCVPVGPTHSPGQMLAVRPDAIVRGIGDITQVIDRATWKISWWTQGPWIQAVGSTPTGFLAVRRYAAGADGALAVSTLGAGSARSSRWFDGSLPHQGNYGASNCIAVQGGFLYLGAMAANPDQGGIYRARTSTLGGRTLATRQRPVAIATDDRWVYWLHRKTNDDVVLRRAPR
ncbi:MAG: hypothetical protein HOO96_19580 [Polyangiaceae bacterium]|nr:hypothetical protein [Polyangiaceae bacterium]